MAANWIHNKKIELTNIKYLERVLMNRPDMRAALNRYIDSLNLQGQINARKITEEQAVALFERAIHQFSYEISKQINQRFTPPFIDQHDLSNPINMERALNNPDSLASVQLNDTAYSVILTINEETDNNEQVQNQQQLIDQQTTQEAMQPQVAPTPTPALASHEKEELLVAAVLGVSLGKEVIEHTFEKYIGKELKGVLQEFKEPDNIKSEFESLVPRPKPPIENDKK